METVKIILLGVAAAVIYGIVYDQVTIRVCPEYFTVFHPHLIDTDSLTLLAATWGVVATWWVGLPIGLLLALSARIGMCKLSVREVAPLVLNLLVIMACCALVAGIAGYVHGTSPTDVLSGITPSETPRFVADWWAHIVSYVSGAIGGLILCGITIAQRIKRASELVS